LRRFSPSQNFGLRPTMLNMRIPPVVGVIRTRTADHRNPAALGPQYKYSFFILPGFPRSHAPRGESVIMVSAV
jgi:hypothetical protein